MKQYTSSLESKKLLLILLLVLLADLAFLNYKVLNPTIVYKEVKIGDSKEEATIEKEDSTASSSSSKTSFVKEFYIPFGTGMNQTDEWTDVPGLQAYIDRSAYSGIKKVTFEASIHVPTGNQTADVRLFNSTKDHAVWDSEMTFTGGGTPQLLISKPITLDSGNNLYKVQMKTQLKYPAYLDQARVRMVVH